MRNQRTIKFNAIMNGILTISNMVFQLITFPYVSRVLLADGTGKVSFYSSIQSYCILFASLGIGTYGIKAVATVRDDKNKLTKTVKELLAINTIVTAFVLLALLVLSVVVPRFRSEPMLLLISILFIMFSPVAMNWLYIGIEEYSYITVRSVVFKLISVVMIFTFVKNKSDYSIYAWILAFSTVGSDICNLIHSREFIIWSRKFKLDLVEHLKPTLVLFASLLAINVYINLDTVMLGFIQDDRAVGIYSLAVKAKLVLLQAINAISAVLLPRLSYYVSKNDQIKYNTLLKKSIVTIMMIAIPSACLFILDAEKVVIILGGDDYRMATTCLRILMPILVISGFSNITGNQILIPLNREKYYLKAVFLGAIVDIVLNILLIKKLNYNGAAYATLIAELVQMSIQTYYSRDYIFKNIKFISIAKIVFSAVIALVITYILRDCFSNIKNDLESFLMDSFVFFAFDVIMLLFMKETIAIAYFMEFIEKIKKSKA